MAVKSCLSGSWFKVHGVGWTNYTDCLDLQALGTCNDRYGSVALDVFKHRSGTLCYGSMHQQTKILFPMGENIDALGPRPGSETDSDSEFTSPIYPDIQNQTITDMICRTLSEDNCERWKSCCHDALECCERQLDTTSPVIDGYCPRQWDGWTCWEDTPSNTDVFQSCPAYIEGFDPGRKYQWCANPCILNPNPSASNTNPPLFWL